MREQGREIETKDSLYQEYNNLMSYVVGLIGELHNESSSLSEKATRRLYELEDRQKNIAKVWKHIWIDNAGEEKHTSNDEIIKKYHDILPMLQELLADIKKFENKKLSI